jgi:hypothetical protein
LLILDSLAAKYLVIVIIQGLNFKNLYNNLILPSIHSKIRQIHPR